MTTTISVEPKKQKRVKLFYIKERHNPQFDGPYYVPCGQLSKSDAKRKEVPGGYGWNKMIPYNTEEEYKLAIEKLRSEGKRVH